MRTLAKTTAGRYRPANGAAYPRSPFGQALQADRAARQGRRRPRDRVCREHATGTITPTKARPRDRSPTGWTTSRAASRRWCRTSASAWPTSVILTMSEFGRTVARERQPRHRSRARQRHVRHRRPGEGRQGLRPLAGPRRQRSATRVATSRSRPISATSSARSSSGTSAYAMPGRFSPASRSIRASSPASWARAGLPLSCGAGRPLSCGAGRPLRVAPGFRCRVAPGFRCRVAPGFRCRVAPGFSPACFVPSSTTNACWSRRGALIACGACVAG